VETLYNVVMYVPVENKIHELHIFLLITLTGIEVITETDLTHSTNR